MKKLLTTTASLALALTLIGAPAFAQGGEKPVSASVEGHIFKPARVDATDARVKQLKVPAGFQITKFAENLNKPRMIAVSNDGVVYVTDRDKGTVTMIRDTNKDGKADEQKVVATKEHMHGIVIKDNQVWLATIKELYTANINKDGSLSELQMLLDDLPDGGQHPNRTLRIGQDNKLYISIGSTCNSCDEPNKEHATILQADLDGKNRKVYAKGLRNTLGFDWHPQTGEMFGMDHGIDWLGDDEQREELNKIEEGADYGWPYIYGEGKENPGDQPEDMSYEEYKKKTKYPLLTYTAHASGLDMIFYKGTQFPKEYAGDAFVAFHGSWNRSKPAGYKVSRIRFENGQPKEFVDFVTGFLVDDNKSQFGRVVGVATHTDGSLLVTDDSNGVVYRIAYTGGKQQQNQRNKK
ncbi:sorbosone dehydrogenase family protein [Pontibacter sp. FD36]|uniref:PQQ-dependent sugar dehydrogenase n=1 Tax=Pontibacter sp. FD36 TaxID=2789860 RepID=UPI0018AA6D21|nr:PQQ-dependent sugar dehydrogenase [Pontibacter sp. FD36]MBF8965664.1 sorbosone dehydrogenase family protein [Pontibacter sp. FD36]